MAAMQMQMHVQMYSDIIMFVRIPNIRAPGPRSSVHNGHI
jgi:hypothetical protein